MATPKIDSDVILSGFPQDVVFDDLGDEQPSLERIYDREFNSPSALEGKYGQHGNYRLVGHGEITNEHCGKFAKFVGCSRLHLHKKIMFDKNCVLTNTANKGFFRPVFKSCDKPSCPRCYERGWATRQARSATFRLGEASKRFGLVEHIMASVPVSDYGLSFEGLRRKLGKVLCARGVIGGFNIWHGFRFDKLNRVWYWSPHFHIVGFVYGGYGRCRNCKDCKCMGYGNFGKCNGFEAVTRKEFEKDGWIVKVGGKRKTIFGTIWYQLHHASIDVSKKRFHVGTWFGVCSYHKLKITKEMRKEYDLKHKPKCPICELPLTRHDYCGHDKDVIDLFRHVRGSRESIKGFFDVVSDWIDTTEEGSGNSASIQT